MAIRHEISPSFGEMTISPRVRLLVAAGLVAAGVATINILDRDERPVEEAVVEQAPLGSVLDDGVAGATVPGRRAYAGGVAGTIAGHAGRDGFVDVVPGRAPRVAAAGPRAALPPADLAHARPDGA